MDALVGAVEGLYSAVTGLIFSRVARGPLDSLGSRPCFRRLVYYRSNLAGIVDNRRRLGRLRDVRRDRTGIGHAAGAQAPYSGKDSENYENPRRGGERRTRDLSKDRIPESLPKWSASFFFYNTVIYPGP